MLSTEHDQQMAQQSSKNSNIDESSKKGMTGRCPSKSRAASPTPGIETKVLEELRRRSLPYAPLKSSNLRLPPTTPENITPPSSPETEAPRLSWLNFPPFLGLKSKDRPLKKKKIPVRRSRTNTVGPLQSPSAPGLDSGTLTDKGSSGLSNPSTPTTEDESAQSGKPEDISGPSPSPTTYGRRRLSERYSRKLSSLQERRQSRVSSSSLDLLTQSIFCSETMKKPRLSLFDSESDAQNAPEAYQSGIGDHHSSMNSPGSRTLTIEPLTPLRKSQSLADLSELYSNSIIDGADNPPPYDRSMPDSVDSDLSCLRRERHFGLGTLLQDEEVDDPSSEDHETNILLTNPRRSRKYPKIDSEDLCPSNSRHGSDPSTGPPPTPRMSFRKLPIGPYERSKCKKVDDSLTKRHDSNRPLTIQSAQQEPTVDDNGGPLTLKRLLNSDVDTGQPSSQHVDYQEQPSDSDTSSEDESDDGSTDSETRYIAKLLLDILGDGTSDSLGNSAPTTPKSSKSNIGARKSTSPTKKDRSFKASSFGEKNITMVDPIGGSIQSTMADNCVYYSTNWNLSQPNKRRSAIQDNCGESPASSKAGDLSESVPEQEGLDVDNALAELAPLERMAGNHLPL